MGQVLQMKKHQQKHHSIHIVLLQPPNLKNNTNVSAKTHAITHCRLSKLEPHTQHEGLKARVSYGTAQGFAKRHNSRRLYPGFGKPE
jgi:hypothetical protein